MASEDPKNKASGDENVVEEPVAVVEDDGIDDALADTGEQEAEESAPQSDLDKEESVPQGERFVDYRALDVDELGDECTALHLSTQGFLLLPRLLKEGAAAACKLSDLLRLKSLLRAKADPSSCGKTDKSPLVWASEKGNLDAVTLLVAAKADLDSQNRFGVSALSTAVRRCHEPIVTCLVEAGATVNIAAVNGYTPLNWAAANGFNDLVEFLVDSRADPVLGTKPAGLTPIHMAAQWGHLKV